MPRSPRKTVNLPDSVQRHLNMYALAASAAGVGMLALSQPVQAKIVYTPANVTLRSSQPYGLDLNHDGKVDFDLVQNFVYNPFASYFQELSVCHALLKSNSHVFCETAPKTLNGVRVSPTGAAALRAGVKIQAGERFRDRKPALMGIVRNRKGTHTSSSIITWSGPWVNSGKGVKNRYLGLKFRINGKFHFGWARLTVTPVAKAGFTATLTGYAYESIPGKSIIAGKTKGPDVTTLDAVSLGHLAAGAPAIPALRSGR